MRAGRQCLLSRGGGAGPLAVGSDEEADPASPAGGGGGASWGGSSGSWGGGGVEVGRPCLRISWSARPQGLGLEKGQRRHLGHPRHKQAVQGECQGQARGCTAPSICPPRWCAGRLTLCPLVLGPGCSQLPAPAPPPQRPLPLRAAGEGGAGKGLGGVAWGRGRGGAELIPGLPEGHPSGL